MTARPPTAFERAILAALARGPQRPVELGEALDADSTTCAQSAQRLVLLGFAVRLDGSRRRRPFAITQAGRAALREPARLPVVPSGGHMIPCRALPDGVARERRRECAHYDTCLAAVIDCHDARCPADCEAWACPSCGATEQPHRCEARHANPYSGAGIGGDAWVYAGSSGAGPRRAA